MFLDVYIRDYISSMQRYMHMVVAKQALISLIKHGWFLLSVAKSELNLPGGYVFPSNPRYKTVWTRRKNVFPETHCILGKPLMPSAYDSYDLSRSKAIVDKIPENATASWPFRCATSVSLKHGYCGRQSSGGWWLWWQSNGTSWNIVPRRPSKLDSS